MDNKEFLIYKVTSSVSSNLVLLKVRDTQIHQKWHRLQTTYSHSFGVKWMLGTLAWYRQDKRIIIRCSHPDPCPCLGLRRLTSEILFPAMGCLVNYRLIWYRRVLLNKVRLLTRVVLLVVLSLFLEIKQMCNLTMRKNSLNSRGTQQ